MSEKSKTVHEHLLSAKESLQKAHDEAGLGTRLMIGSLLADLISLIERVESIDERNNDDTDTNGREN